MAVDAKKIEARFKDGVHACHAAEDAKPKQIEVKVS